jgi:hypothetical protein
MKNPRPKARDCRARLNKSHTTATTGKGAWRLALGIICVGAFFLVGAIGIPASLHAADNGATELCGRVVASARQKIAQQTALDLERREQAFPGSDKAYELLKECLGGIFQPTPFARFPQVPSIEDVARGLCREIRNELNIGTISVPTIPGLPRLDGTNTVSQWNGLLNEDIRNALSLF